MLWKKITLVTPVDNEENIKFYTEKCGFSIGTREMNGNVEVVRFFGSVRGEFVVIVKSLNRRKT